MLCPEHPKIAPIKNYHASGCSSEASCFLSKYRSMASASGTNGESGCAVIACSLWRAFFNMNHFSEENAYAD
ncbi:MAG: hypothetical protein D3904_08750 [Candidatus Electrothrix sp. EH2]|nr:hypothetical protein [Candidatus Electrothrix sp. EH2]